jgi:hypothetical protein
VALVVEDRGDQQRLDVVGVGPCAQKEGRGWGWPRERGGEAARPRSRASPRRIRAVRDETYRGR